MSSVCPWCVAELPGEPGQCVKCQKCGSDIYWGGGRPHKSKLQASNAEQREFIRVPKMSGQNKAGRSDARSESQIDALEQDKSFETQHHASNDIGKLGPIDRFILKVVQFLNRTHTRQEVIDRFLSARRKILRTKQKILALPRTVFWLVMVSCAAVCVFWLGLNTPRIVVRNARPALDEITALTEAIATELIDYQGEQLDLSSVRVIDQASAHELAKWKGKKLVLSGLNSIEPNIARELADWRGETLDLSGIESLNQQVVRAIAEWQGTLLQLNGVKSLGEDTARVLLGVQTVTVELLGLLSLEENAFVILNASPRISLPARNLVAAQKGVASSRSEAANGVVDLLKGNLQPNKAWEVVDGMLTPVRKPQGGNYIWSKDVFDDFEVTLEYKTSEKCNSGLFFRSDPKNPVQGGFEVQIASPGLYSGKTVAGALYDAKEPRYGVAKPDGEWNQMTLRCQGPHIHAVLNGQEVLDLSVDDWNKPGQNPDGSKNKFVKALKDLPRRGHVGLQYHGQPIWIRTLQVRRLKPERSFSASTKEIGRNKSSQVKDEAVEDAFKEKVKDPKKITSLNVAQARYLVRHGPGGTLHLDALNSIGVEAARELVKCRANHIVLGVKTLSADVATELVNFPGHHGEGEWNFLGLTAIDKDVAGEIAKMKGKIWFGRVRSISRDAAAALVRFRGRGMYFRDLSETSVESLSILNENERVVTYEQN